MGAILLYDGDCGGCTVAAAWIARRWRDDSRITPSQRWSDADLAAVGLTRADVGEQVWWIEGSRARGGARAVAAALSRGPRHLRAIGAVMDHRAVRPLAQRAYFVVARHRHWLPGSSEVCRIT